MTRAGGHHFNGERMTKQRSIAAVLFAFSLAAPAYAAYAEPLEREQCDALKVQIKTLLTPTVGAALQRGPDWVKDHLHDKDMIEQVRQYLSVEEQIAFRCRTDGVRIPKPEPPSLPDRKPSVPTYVMAGVAASSLMPYRNPSRPVADAIAAALAESEGEGDIDDNTDLAAGDTTAAASAPAPVAASAAAPGASQAIVDSDKTAPSGNKATQ